MLQLALSVKHASADCYKAIQHQRQLHVTSQLLHSKAMLANMRIR